jgi:hypothetical protein
MLLLVHLGSSRTMVLRGMFLCLGIKEGICSWFISSADLMNVEVLATLPCGWMVAWGAGSVFATSVRMGRGWFRLYEGLTCLECNLQQLFCCEDFLDLAMGAVWSKGMFRQWIWWVDDCTSGEKGKGTCKNVSTIFA